ncbi:MAG: 3TM-type holin [Terriglobia bacterium]
MPPLFVYAALDHIKMTPEQKAQVEEAMQANQLELATLAESYDSQIITQVNTTMQAEAKSEHWLQWAWRPLVGLTFSLTIISNYVLLPYFAKVGLQPIVIPGDVWNTMLIVLGVAAGTRGYEKIVKAQGASQSNGHS